MNWSARDLKHAAFLQEEVGWGVTKIGKELNRSRGAVSSALSRWRRQGYIPPHNGDIGRPSAIKRRNVTIRMLRSQGRTVREIAEGLNLSERRVWSVLCDDARRLAKMGAA